MLRVIFIITLFFSGLSYAETDCKPAKCYEKAMGLHKESIEKINQFRDKFDTEQENQDEKIDSIENQSNSNNRRLDDLNGKTVNYTDCAWTQGVCGKGSSSAEDNAYLDRIPIECPAGKLMQGLRFTRCNHATGKNYLKGADLRMEANCCRVVLP